MEASLWLKTSDKWDLLYTNVDQMHKISWVSAKLSVKLNVCYAIADNDYYYLV